ncbi:hypothetical protein, partial [Salmonella sp. s54412]|uniref:hypothetical protein n=1 Tax=Salmonella sp. s54412 TaxID=3160128 RepID=UPI00375466FA
FTVFQWTIENMEQLMADHQDVIEAEKQDIKAYTNSSTNVKPAKEKKIHLTKNQKRKLADRTNVKGERERGWDWVDLVKHLSKTGFKEDN